MQTQYLISVLYTIKNIKVIIAYLLTELIDTRTLTQHTFLFEEGKIKHREIKMSTFLMTHEQVL